MYFFSLAMINVNKHPSPNAQWFFPDIVSTASCIVMDLGRGVKKAVNIDRLFLNFLPLNL